MIINDISELPNSADTVLEINTSNKKLNQLMRDTIVSLKNTIREKNLDGLTACQIGVNIRVMVINFNGDLKTYVNPLLVKADGFVLNRESCIHIPDKTYLVPRHKSITIIYETPLGKIEEAKLVGKAAYVAQHLIWHMDGMFIDDVGLEIDEDWDELTDEEKSQIIKEYAESLDIRAAELNDELDKTEQGKKLKEGVEFEQAVARGEVRIKEEAVYTTDNTKEENKDNGTDTV